MSATRRACACDNARTIRRIANGADESFELEVRQARRWSEVVHLSIQEKSWIWRAIVDKPKNLNALT